MASGRKLSYKETRELEQLPKEIEALEQEQGTLIERMSAADYHKQGADRMKADQRRAEQIEKDLSQRFDRWAQLEAKSTQPR